MGLGMTVGHSGHSRRIAQTAERRVHRAGAHDDCTHRFLHDRHRYHVAFERLEDRPDHPEGACAVLFLTVVALVLGLATAFALHPGAGLHIDAHHLDTAVPRAVFDAHAVARARRIRAACDSGDACRRLRERRGAAGPAARPAVRLRAERQRERRPAGTGIHRWHRARAVPHPRADHAARARSAHSARWPSPWAASASARSARSAC